MLSDQDKSFQFDMAPPTRQSLISEKLKKEACFIYVFIGSFLIKNDSVSLLGSGLDPKSFVRKHHKCTHITFIVVNKDSELDDN